MQAILSSKKILISASILGMFFLSVQFSHAGALTFVTDLISTSTPNDASNHTIRFSASSAIPPSGEIAVILTDDFTTPGGLDYTDTDLATSSSFGGPWVDRDLDSTPTASLDGFTASGTQYIFNLNSTNGIATGTFIQIEIGSNATYAATGSVNQIINASTSSIVPYKVIIETRDASSQIIDIGETYIVILPGITLSVNIPNIPPIRTNGLPGGSVPADLAEIIMSLDTHEAATCRYETSPGIVYSSMTNSFTADAAGRFHSVSLTGLPNGSAQAFYIRCEDTIGLANPDDFVINFSIDNPPPPPGTGGSGGGSGSGFPFPSPPSGPQVSIEGFSYPLTFVTILKDGGAEQTTGVDVQGRFSINVLGLTQGTYTFSITGEDPDKTKSVPHSTTFTARAGTRTAVTDIVIPPTISFVNDTITPGGTLEVFGYAAPSTTVEVWISPPGSNKPSETTVLKSVSNTAGRWEADFNTTGLDIGTYDARARYYMAGLDLWSNFSRFLNFGVGQAPTPDFCSNADINKDGKVNLTDFSILLFHWGTTNVIADINFDGRVTLTDFSIMLFCWTG